MSKKHPEYRTVEIKDGTFGVEVTTASAMPVTIGGFGSEAEAQAWIARERKGAPDVSQRAKSIADQVTGNDD